MVSRVILAQKLLLNDVKTSLNLLSISKSLEALSDHLDKVASHWSVLSNQKNNPEGINSLRDQIVEYLDMSQGFFRTYRQEQNISQESLAENNSILKKSQIGLHESLDRLEQSESLGSLKSLMIHLMQIRREIKHLGSETKAIGKA